MPESGHGLYHRVIVRLGDTDTEECPAEREVGK